MGKTRKFQGDLAGVGFAGKVFVMKVEVPSGSLAIAAGSGVVIGTEWTEIAAWSSCKLIARKMGAVTRYAQLHYGQYDCCLKAKVELMGHQVYGVSKASMPIWMRSSLDGYWPKGWPKARVVSWTRTSMDVARVVIASEWGARHEIMLRRDQKPRPGGA